MHLVREMESLEIHRRVSRRLIEDSEPVPARALANLNRWRAVRSENPAFAEWEKLIKNLTCKQLADFLVSNTETADRLRQSSPFAGVLPPKEIWEIKRKNRHAAV